MKLPDLQKQIVSGDFENLYIFVGEEIAVMDIYLQKIEVAFPTMKRVESVREAYGRITQKTIGKPACANCYVVRDDREFQKDEKVWTRILSEIKHDMLILVYSSMDKRTKFYKQNEEHIVEFEKMSPQILTKYIQKELPGMPSHKCEQLAYVCECNYSRVLLECDKIHQYCGAHPSYEYQTSLRILLEQGVIFQPIGDITFKFTDAVLVRDINASGELLESVRKKGESEILLLSVLYNGFKHILMYQGLGANSNQASERTGLTGWQVMNAKQKSGHYTLSELIHALRVIRGVEKGIKTGQIDADISLEYVLLNIL